MTAGATKAQEPHDSHQYFHVMFLRETVEFFAASAKYYAGLLEAENLELASEPHLSSLLNDDARREFRLNRDLEKAKRVGEWLKQELTQSNDYDTSFSLAHGSVRYLKSVGLLYLGFLKQRRNALSKSPNVTANLLNAVDRQISKHEETLQTAGVFADASTIPLLVEQQVASAAEPEPITSNSSVINARRPRPVVLSSIEILDPELRARCLDLLDTFQKSGQSDRHDTVVSEATRILEDRLRKWTKSTDAATGPDLATRAFAGTSPMFEVSSIANEQKGVHHLHLGAFGFIRNRVQHKLHPDLPAERVIQILGFIDYLLSLLAAAKPAEQLPSADPSAAQGA